MNEKIQLWHGDCLELMADIPDGSVDLVLADPPYGTINGAGLNGWKGNKTAWDKPIDHNAVLEHCNRVLRTNGALVLFAQEPYTSKLITNTHGNLPFSYRLIWLKDHFANALIAKKAPVNYTEDICVFFKKYDILAQHPLRAYAKEIMAFIGKTKKQLFAEMGHQRADHFFRIDSTEFSLCTEATYNELIEGYGIDRMSGFMSYTEMVEIDRRFRRRFNLPEGAKYKSNVLEYKKDYSGLHPTQKPVALIEDLIKTYTNLGETVLDFVMGSGTTGVACVNTGRRFIGIELDKNYYEIACKRINDLLRRLKK